MKRAKTKHITATNSHAVVGAARSNVVAVGAEARTVPVDAVCKTMVIQGYTRGVCAQVDDLEGVVAAVGKQFPLVLRVAAHAGDGRAVQASNFVNALTVPAQVPYAHNIVNMATHGTCRTITGEAKIIDG